MAAFQRFDLPILGICDAQSAPAKRASFDAWIAAEHHGGMDWLARHAERKYDPQMILPGCRSILVTGLSYWQEGAAPSGAGRIARYAWGRDYHKVLGNRLKKLAQHLMTLFPGETCKGYTDAVALDERHYAEKAGAGFIGRNTLLISTNFGSWFVLGEILSTRAWPQTPPPNSIHGACPTACRKCIDICPTGALTGPGQIDARRCISYLTIEHKGSIPLELRPLIGNWLFGCDLCQEVCPFQLRKKTTTEADFLAWRAGPGVALAELLSLNESGFAQKFAGTPLMRTGLQRIQRNACIVAGNLQDQDAQPALERIAQGTDPLLREHAAWALTQYPSPSP